MEIKFHQPRAVASEILFVRPNILEAPFPDIADNQIGRELLAPQGIFMDTHHQDLFVVGSIKDADAATFWELFG